MEGHSKLRVCGFYFNLQYLQDTPCFHDFLIFLVKEYSSFNLRVKGETDRVFNILTLLHMLCFLDVFLRKSFGFLPVFPLKGKKVPETLTCNKWGSLGVAKLVWNVESLST